MTNDKPGTHFYSKAVAQRSTAKPRKSQNKINPVQQALACSEDEAAACEGISLYSLRKWDETHSRNFHTLSSKKSLKGQELRECEEELAALRKVQDKTKRRIPVNQVNKPEDQEANQWSDYDRYMWLGQLGLSLFALGILGVNVYTNLMASQDPIFLDNWWLAAALSVMAPMAALTIKFFTHQFDHDETRHCYTLAVYSATLITLLIWIYLFSQSFTGVSSGVDIESLLSGSHGGAALVAVQLLAELLAGAALFLGAERIHSKYSPHITVQNPEWLANDNEIKSLRESRELLCEQLAALEGEWKALESSRQLCSDDGVAELLLLRKVINAPFNTLN